MSEKWILIVDDEESILTVMLGSLNKLDQEYHVITVTNGQDALEQIKLQPFDLVITDYRMAGMNGLQLMEKIRLVHPDTRVILMTAYADASVEAEATRLNAYRYLIKPLNIDSFLKIVKDAIGTGGLDRSGLLVLSEDDYGKINQVLRQLEKDVGARCIFLTDGEGRTISRAGHFEKLPISRIASLLSGSIATLAEAGTTIDNNANAINLAYREGKSDNLYAINIGSQFLLIILIDRTYSSSRLGLVWYYAQSAVASLLKEMNNAKYTNPGDMLGENIEQEINGEFEKLFSDGKEADTDKKKPTSSPTPENSAE